MQDYLSEGFDAPIIDISNLAIYNSDLDDEENIPASWVKLRKDIAALDAVLFVTPEYNRSVPAALKNTLDIASRPYGKNLWDGKPGFIVSVSPGALGAFGANHHLRQSLVFLNVLVMQQPEAYIGHVADAIDESGNVTSERTKEFIHHLAQSFSNWINRLSE